MIPPTASLFRSSWYFVAVGELVSPIQKTALLYKSLFAENSVATQKQYSTSVNANKIQNTTIKSVTSSFFTKLNYLLHLITKQGKAKAFLYVFAF